MLSLEVLVRVYLLFSFVDISTKGNKQYQTKELTIKE